MTKITIIRHAEAEGNLYRRVHGWFNSNITPTGRAQIQRLEERFRDDVANGINYDVIYSSDLIRTMETAGAVSRAAGISIIPHPGLREIHSGEWEDRTWGYCFRNYSELLNTYASHPEWKIEGGESIETLYRRLSDTLEEILAENTGKSICIVSHAVAIRALLCRMNKTPTSEFTSLPEVDNASVTCYTYDGKNFNEVYVNDTSHLDGIIPLRAILDGHAGRSAQLWFRSVNPKDDLHVVEEFWRDSWKAVHGNLYGFDGPTVRSETRRMLRLNPDSVCFAMLDDQEVGIIAMDSGDLTMDDCGHISLFAIAPEYRGKRLAVQLLGQAVSFYRTLGRKYLKLYVAPDNHRAIQFYKKNDFVEKGYGPGIHDNLLVMIKKI
ncbi:MAG: GNAT family N-acetyltransferase [Clostridiales bacterium]|nr:GNAT family N-acetyltransferase [Clostridiales bacterium]